MLSCGGTNCIVLHASGTAEERDKAIRDADGSVGARDCTHVGIFGVPVGIDVFWAVITLMR